MAEATVLVVEDEESFVDALMVSLRREGFVVHVALLTLHDKIPPSAYGACQIWSSIVLVTSDGQKEQVQWLGE